MHALVDAVVDDLSIESIEALYEHCITLPPRELFGHRRLLHALYSALWGVGLGTVTRLKSKSFAPSMMVLLCCAHSVPNALLQADTRGLEHFPLIEIQDVWKHHGKLGPVRTMSLQLVVNLLDGVEWNMFSDLTFGSARRTPQWLRQAVELVGLLRKRVYYFIRCTSNDAVLNVPMYVDKSRIAAQSNLVETGDYDSDEEVSRAKKSKHIIVPSEMEAHDCVVNNSFIFDMDSMLGSIYSRLMLHETVTDLRDPPNVCITAFRAWIMSEIKTINAKYAVSAREKWHLGLILTDTYYRVEARKSWLGKPQPKQIVYKRNFNLPATMPKHFCEIELPADKHHEEMMRLNTDAMLMHLSAQLNVCQTVYLPDIPDPPKTDECYIFRLPLTMHWVCHVTPHLRYKCSSLTHAFAVMRVAMRALNMPPMVRRVKLDQFDGHIFG